MKAVVFSLGCKVNECESDSLIAGLIDRGFEVSDKLERADIYIVNTCAVTKEAEKKSRQTEARIKKLNKNAKIIYTGCACQKNPKAFYNKSPNYLVTGTFNKGAILDMLDCCGEKIFPCSSEFENLPTVKTLRSRAFVKVQDGCDNFCSYCIIPYLRGRSRSRDYQSIISEINAISPKEVVLNGINLSSYNYEGKGLIGLIERLKDINARIRLGSLEVNVITKEFLLALKSLKNFAEHFHLSLQSGSNKVLKSMNRHYLREDFIEKCNLIRSVFPNAGITTDIIVGFPTESEEDFLDTLSLVDIVKFSDIHPFIFSPREGTVAYKMKDIDYSIKKQRLDRLLEVKSKVKDEFERAMIGREETFVLEYTSNGYGEGYTGNYLRAFIKDFDNDFDKKEIVRVKITGLICGGVTAQILK